ncbi:MAG TPA: amidase family protein [Rhizomicrobium sp.]|nr:amidase family protein [Rhizomicrobium sp.]
MIDTYATARSMLADLRTRKISARELLDAHVARNDRIAKSINAVIETDIARAQNDAAAIDERRAKGAELGVLAGLPMTIKDGFDVFNMPASSGARGFHGRNKNCLDADVVSDARKAGAVIWGKTNVPYMLSDIQSYNEIYGTTNNPYDVTRTPGGSSGGAAAALAAGVTPLEIGSDIGGSLRHPANFCGVTSLKATWGALSGRGHVPPAPDRYWECDLGVYGPMARNVDDLKLLWSVLRGTPEQTRRDVKGTRVAIWNEEPSWPLAREVKQAADRAGEALAGAGAHVEHAKPDIDGATLMDFYLTILTAIIAAGLPAELMDSWEDMRASDKKLVAGGGEGAAAARYRLRATASFRDIAAANIAQQAHKDRLATFFTRYDALVMPISMVTAFPHQQQPGFNDRILDVDGRPTPYPAILNWISPATALHAPALAVQAGQTEKGLPVGVQIVGPWHREDRLFDFAFAVEEGLGGFRRPPI